jgi:hypothetical protein
LAASGGRFWEAGIVYDNSVTGLVYLALLASAVWVGFDSKRLGVKAGVLGGGMADIGPVGWFFVVLLLWIIGFPAYLATRPKYVALASGTAVAIGGSAQTAGSGWHPDPLKRHEKRFWNGTEWTEHVSDAGVPSTDPL